MLANVNRNLLFIVLIVAFFVSVFTVIGGLIWAFVRLKKNCSPHAKKTVVFTLLSIVVAAASWILNFGWMRFFMTLLALPFLHGVGYFLANMFFAKYVDQSPEISKMNFWFIATYLLAYLFFPDGGDIGEAYFFFGLIQSDALFSIAYYVSVLAMIGHVVLFVMQIDRIRKIKNTTEAQNETNA